ncbi:MAG TPA: efflux RND transporter periplasmic adaptor subunit [Kofleriaceae bacterium]|nr:efflux RND transporter periplasmic adaptor subunit [Kofleriaceae bacterium]
MSFCQFHTAALAVTFATACSASAESTPSFSPALAAPDRDGTVQVSERALPYVVSRPVALEDATPVVRVPARVAFRDGAVSQINLPVPGRVVAVHVKTGDRVAAGDPLITLSSPEAAAARAALTTAQADHDASAAEVARQDRMAAGGVGIESEHAAARARLRQVEAELARAQTTAALLGGAAGPTVVLRAPIAGTVIARRATVGSVAQPGGEPLIELGDPAALWVVAEVFERDLVQVHEGSEVDVELSAEGRAVPGHVVTVGSALTGSMRTAPVYIALDGTAPSLRAGMFGRAAIKTPAGRSIVLPAEAVLIEGGKRSIVYLDQGGGRFAAREVTVGRSVDGKVQVIAGLRAGDKVVVKGALLLNGAAEQLL